MAFIKRAVEGVQNCLADGIDLQLGVDARVRTQVRPGGGGSPDLCVDAGAERELSGADREGWAGGLGRSSTSLRRFAFGHDGNIRFRPKRPSTRILPRAVAPSIATSLQDKMSHARSSTDWGLVSLGLPYSNISPS